MLSADAAWLSRPAVRFTWLFSAAYFTAAELGHFLSFPDPGFATFWPPSGLYLGALLLCDHRRWPAFIIAALPANLLSDVLVHDKSIALSLVFWLANSLEALTGASLIRRLVPQPTTLGGPRELLVLLVAGALFAPAISALLGATAILMAYDAGSFWQTYQTWWGSSALGVILVTPVLLTWNTDDDEISPRRRTIARRIEWFVALAVLLAMSVRAFDKPPDTEVLATRFPMFILTPILTWLAIRFRPFDAVLGVLAMSLVVVWCTTRGLGGIARPEFDYADRLFILQVFLTVSSCVTVLLVTTIQRRELAEWRLQQALNEIRTLRGLISICAKCKRIFNDDGQWQSIESYVSEHTDAEFTHGVCPSCGEAVYGDLWPDIVKRLEETGKGPPAPRSAS